MRLVAVAYPGKAGKYGLTHLVAFSAEREGLAPRAICGCRGTFTTRGLNGGEPVECSRCLAKMREGRIR